VQAREGGSAQQKAAKGQFRKGGGTNPVVASEAVSDLSTWTGSRSELQSLQRQVQTYGALRSITCSVRLCMRQVVAFPHSTWLRATKCRSTVAEHRDG
jgi:hypothetical protein